MEKNKKKPDAKCSNKANDVKLPPIENKLNSDKVKVKTVLDIDPQFFSLVEGRPIHSNSSINFYKQNVREVALKRTVRGFLVDELLRIDKEIDTERSIFEKATKHFEECKNSFDKFLAYDNNKTISIMQKSDALNKKLMNKTEDHKMANYEMASLKSKIQYTDETLLILLSFENFLHKTAPHLWQQSQNIKLETKHEEIFKVESDIFREIDVSFVKNRLNLLPPPRLYFETPDQLLNIFYLLEKQNLNYLLKTEDVGLLKNKFLNARHAFQENLKMDLNVILLKIKEIEDVIQWYNIKENDIKEVFYKILEEKIRYLVSSEMALQIHTHVEFAYEQIVAPNDTKQSTLDMSLALENEYNNLLLDLSLLDLELVNEIEKNVFEKGVEDIHNAQHANQMLKNVDKVSKRLHSSFEPSKHQNF